MVKRYYTSPQPMDMQILLRSSLKREFSSMRRTRYCTARIQLYLAFHPYYLLFCRFHCCFNSKIEWVIPNLNIILWKAVYVIHFWFELLLCSITSSWSNRMAGLRCSILLRMVVMWCFPYSLKQAPTSMHRTMWGRRPCSFIWCVLIIACI